MVFVFGVATIVVHFGAVRGRGGFRLTLLRTGSFQKHPGA